MRQTLFVGWCVLALACVAAAGPRQAKTATVVVQGPTVIAFFEPVTDAELDKDADLNETLSDFQLYARKAREPLRKAGVEFHELYVNSFQLRIGQSLTSFRPTKATVGYYFIAPGKKPQIEYGVMTDLDLLDLANKYFKE
jgi:hypothetical protein